MAGLGWPAAGNSSPTVNPQNDQGTALEHGDSPLSTQSVYRDFKSVVLREALHPR